MTFVVQRAMAGFLENRAYTGFNLNQEILKGNLLNDFENQMQIDTAANSEEPSLNYLNSHYPVTYVVSIQTVTINDQDQVLCGFSDGRVLSFCCDLTLLD